MKNYWLFVDDLREVPFYWQEPTCPREERENSEIVVIRTFDEAYTFIEQNWNNIDRVSLDHDLGEEDRMDGYELACLIEELAYRTDRAPRVMLCHSANPVGWTKIMDTFGAIRRRFGEV